MVRVYALCAYAAFGALPMRSAHTARRIGRGSVLRGVPLVQSRRLALWSCVMRDFSLRTYRFEGIGRANAHRIRPVLRALIAEVEHLRKGRIHTRGILVDMVNVHIKRSPML